ncbi:MAG: hypothetical protein RL885_03635 [Planctomycetota bacterium]
MTRKRSSFVIRTILVVGAAVGLVYVAATSLGLKSVLDALTFRDKQLQEALEEKKELERRNETLEQIAQRLTERRVIANVVVVDQVRDDDGKLWTDVRILVSPRREGDPTPPAKGPFRIEGDIVYFESLIIQFDEEKVKMGDPLRGKAAYLLTRVFGEKQAPEDGYPLEDLTSKAPTAYELGEPELAKFEREIWKEFWKYAQDRELAQADGIDAAYGNAVFLKVGVDKIYEIVISNQGGLKMQEKL